MSKGELQSKKMLYFQLIKDPSNENHNNENINEKLLYATKDIYDSGKH